MRVHRMDHTEQLSRIGHKIWSPTALGISFVMLLVAGVAVACYFIISGQVPNVEIDCAKGQHIVTHHINKDVTTVTCLSNR